MPLTAISLARLSECHPLLAARAKQVSLQFEEAFAGWTIQVSQGLRLWAYQAALWARGRESTEAVNALNRVAGIPQVTDAQNVKVTNAEPGQSNHEYGYAIDWDIANAEEGVLDWSGHDDKWQKLIALAAPNGLRSGACFHDPDRPHMELAEVPEIPTSEDISILKNEGLTAVWQQSGLPSA